MADLPGTFTHTKDGVMEFHLPEHDWIFRWEGYEGGTGGEYIQIYRSGEEYPFEVTNTVPAGKSNAELPDFTEANFRSEIADWLADADIGLYHTERF